MGDVQVVSLGSYWLQASGLKRYGLVALRSQQFWDHVEGVGMDEVTAESV